jgi:hypothetical protein
LQLDRTKRIVERVWNAIRSEHFSIHRRPPDLSWLPLSRSLPKMVW